MNSAKSPADPPSPEYWAAAEGLITKIRRQMAFGYFEGEDIAQEARILALQAWRDGAYDRSRPPTPFLRAHFHNKLGHLYRAKCQRNDPPCRACHAGTPCPAAGVAAACRPYAAWRALNDAKKGLLSPAGYDEAVLACPDAGTRPPEQEDAAAAAELAALLDARLPAALRTDYLRMRAGRPVARHRREKIRETILIIIRDHAPSLLESFGFPEKPGEGGPGGE